MIQNAVLHLAGEQPLLVDLEAVPTAAYAALRCRNVRFMNGKRPVFIERPDALCLFPMVQVRFIEIPAPAPSDGSSDARDPDRGDAGSEHDLNGELELDEDFLRRIREA